MLLSLVILMITVNGRAGIVAAVIGQLDIRDCVTRRGLLLHLMIPASGTATRRGDLPRRMA